MMRDDIAERVEETVKRLAPDLSEPDVRRTVVELYTGGLEASTPDLPRSRRVSSVQAAARLRDLSEAASRLVTMFSEMPPNSLHALAEERERQTFIGLAQAGLNKLPAPPAAPYLDVLGLSRFAKLAEQAAIYLQATQDYGQGRPTKPSITRFVRTSLDVYERLTGSRATLTTDAIERGHPASGAFLEFVRGLLGLFGIEASAESQARLAIKEKRSGEN